MYVQWQEMRSVRYNRNYDSVYILFIKKSKGKEMGWKWTNKYKMYLQSMVYNKR